MITKVKIEQFEDIIAWQKSQELALMLYKLLRNCRDADFRSQIQRAAVSVSNNIAEGYERRGDRELRKFLYISKGSCGEVRSMLYLALKLDYISNAEFNKLNDLATEISKALSGFIKACD